ncbi:unnamed protein product [Bursaphelenchus xylophilus]|uniref:(pine wood nematode) hypothetical protein n=1 Tax=Bursaphelenchus xylophilus TaxID=6326 RepID=A0A7I8X3C5_BURXY|nr:unnamed protein product [Bursaphelenchus xylophilus]CAG9128436.1 unnamed protein product [Bursaphelenchus xylophilus]
MFERLKKTKKTRKVSSTTSPNATGIGAVRKKKSVQKDDRNMGHLKSVYTKLHKSKPKISQPAKEEETMSGEALVEFQQQFSSSRRAGRRNAMGDLGLEGVDPGAHKLADEFEKMGRDSAEQPGTSTQKTGDE